MQIKDFKTKKLDTTNFLEPIKCTYRQNGIEKSWEAVRSFDSVAILLYHEFKNQFVLVKQFRPPVYMTDSSKLYTYELCAGIIDKNKSLKSIAKEEILEECGYNVKIDDIEKITSFFTNVGVSGGKQTLFFAQINDSMKIHDGGGIDSEYIEIVYLDILDFEKFIFDGSKAKTPGLMFSFLWFMRYKNKSIMN